MAQAALAHPPPVDEERREAGHADAHDRDADIGPREVDGDDALEARVRQAGEQERKIVAEIRGGEAGYGRERLPFRRQQVPQRIVRLSARPPAGKRFQASRAPWMTPTRAWTASVIARRSATSARGAVPAPLNVMAVAPSTVGK